MGREGISRGTTHVDLFSPLWFRYEWR